MRSLLLAITWEMFNRDRWAMIFGLLYAICLPSILYGSLLQVEGFDLADSNMRTIHMVLLQISTYVLAGMILASQAFISRLYTYPIKTSTIVACHMFLAMAFACGGMLISTIFINALFKPGWPLWGPAFFAAASIAAYQATFWYTEKSSWMPLVAIAVFGGLGYWYQTRFSASNVMWQHLTNTEVVTMASVAVASYFVGVAGVSRNRCGEQIKSLGIITLFSQMLDRQFSFELKFQTPLEAQLWFEWKKKSWLLPAFAIVGLFILICVCLDTAGNSKEMIAAFVGGGVLLSFFGMFIGMIIGSMGSLESNLEMGHFLGSRPLTNSDFARTILTVVGRTVLIVWGVWALAFFVTYTAYLTCSKAPPLPEWVHWWYFPATLLGFWTVTATAASFSMTGRTKFFAQIFVGIMIFYFVLLVFNAFAPSKELLNRVNDGLAVVWGICFVVGSGWVFVVARRKRLVGNATISASLGVWLTLCVIGAFESMQLPKTIFPGYFVFVGLAALTVFPVAAAPLAISSNRTR